MYVKHLNEFDHIEIVRMRTERFNKYLTDGIPSQKERLKILDETKEWTKKDEENILGLKQIISDNERHLITLIPQMQVKVKEIIQQNKEKLNKELFRRRDLMGSTADEFCERDVVNYMTMISLFDDAELKNKAINSWDEWEQLDEEIMAEYLHQVDKVFSKFNENVIKQISAMPFFINVFSYSREDLSTFLRKPVAKLTNYQLLLFSLGSRNLNIMTQSDGEPPDVFNDSGVAPLVNWYDQQYSVLLGKRKTKK